MSQDTTRMGFGAYLKAYFKQCLEVFKHPKLLLPTVIMAVIWIGLGILQNKVERNLPLSILNFLTFAQGGLYGGIIGAIGGIMGKIVVAAFVNIMIVPLFYKKHPFANFKQGFQEIIANIKFESKDATALLLKGSGAALLLYCIFNSTQSFENSLVGIVSVVALISAAARKQGFLWGLVISWMNSVTKGKVPSYQQIIRILTGLTLGFTLGVLLSAVGSMWAGSIGMIALFVGWIIERGAKKETVTYIILIALFLLPKAELWASGRGKWTLVDVKTESIPTCTWTGLHGEHTSVTLSGTTASYRIDYVFGKDAGYYTGSITPFYGSYAPGYVFEGKSETNLGQGTKWFDIANWNWSYVWVSFAGVDRDRGARIGWELRNDLPPFNFTFPPKEDVGSDQFIFEATMKVMDAYIRTAYYFEWNSKRKAVTNPDGSDDSWDDDDWDDDIEITLPTWIEKLFGTDGTHTPDAVTILIGILGAIGGLGGSVGGGTDGGGIPTGNVPSGNGPTGNGPEPKPEPTPEELEWEKYQKEKDERFKKYLKDNPDGTKTYTDPATGEKHTLYPKYNTETGAFTHWENENDSPYDEDKLNDWLAWRERNSEHFAQNEAQAQQNLAEQRAMNQAQNDFDRERGSSAMADKWKTDKEQMEKDYEHEMHVYELAWKHGLATADKEALTKALMKDTHTALEDGAEAMNNANYWNDWVTSTELVETASDKFINIAGETSPMARKIKNFYTFAKSVAKHGSMGIVKGQGFGGLAAEVGVGIAEGGLGVLQNEEMTGTFGESFTGGMVKSGVNVAAEMGKTVLNDLLDPNKSASDIMDDLTTAGVNRIGYEFVGKVTGFFGEKASDTSQWGVNTISAINQEAGTHEAIGNVVADEINHFRQTHSGR